MRLRRDGRSRRTAVDDAFLDDLTRAMCVPLDPRPAPAVVVNGPYLLPPELEIDLWPALELRRPVVRRGSLDSGRVGVRGCRPMSEHAQPGHLDFAAQRGVDYATARRDGPTAAGTPVEQGFGLLETQIERHETLLSQLEIGLAAVLDMPSPMAELRPDRAAYDVPLAETLARHAGRLEGQNDRVAALLDRLAL